MTRYVKPEVPASNVADDGLEPLSLSHSLPLSDNISSDKRERRPNFRLNDHADALMSSGVYTEPWSAYMVKNMNPPDSPAALGQLAQQFNASMEVTSKSLESEQYLRHGSTDAVAGEIPEATTKGPWGEHKDMSLVSNDQEVDASDTDTVYSDGSILPSNQKDDYVRELADELRHQFNNMVNFHDDIARDRVTTVLPELLKGFSLKIGHGAESNKHRDIMVFVHKHRKEIVDAFKDLTTTKNKSMDDNESASSIELPYRRKIAQEVRQEMTGEWLLNLGTYSHDELHEDVHNKDSALGEYTLDPKAKKDAANPKDNSITSEADSEGADSEMDLEVEGVGDNAEGEESNNLDVQKKKSMYASIIHDTPAYQWLLGRLRREVIIGASDFTAVQGLRQMILLALPKPRISKRSPAQVFTMKFELIWDILAFLQQQEYEAKPYEALPQVITLTGTSPHVQALSCEEYMRQTWQTTADAVLEAVQIAVRRSYDSSTPTDWNKVTLADGTSLETQISGPKFLVRVSGVSFSIVEIAEQFAWLGAALRSSPDPDTMAYSQLRAGKVDNGKFEIDFVMKEIQREPPWSTTGQCWHNFFRSPVIAQGFPVHQRTGLYSCGLEMPLNIMAGLVGTSSVDYFNGSVFLKGFSAMLIATARQDDVILWHLVCSVDGGRVSYLDAPTSCLETVSRVDLESHRHVVGWCSSAHFLAGSPKANYTIRRSALPRPDRGSPLQDISVSPSRGVIKGPRFLQGIKERPSHIITDGFIPSLKWIEQQLVLLWDEDDKRGWLLNGTTALLHLVRASLEHNRSDSASSAFLLQVGAIREADKMFQSFSAMGVLVDKENLQLPLYENEDGSHVRLRSRIKHYAGILEKLIDMQPGISAEEENSFKGLRKLGGWDFSTLSIESKDTAYLHIATLSEKTSGWINFLRATRTVSLFGRGVGELIQPLVSEDICPHWLSLPKGKYYIAIGVSDLQPVVERAHSLNIEQLHLTEDLVWNPSIADSEICRNKDYAHGTEITEPCSPSQAFLSNILTSYLEGQDWAMNSFPYSVIVFGYHLDFISTGKACVARSEVEEVAESASSVSKFYDSGVGLSRDHTFSQPNQSDISLTQASLSHVKLSGVRRKFSIGIICALSKELLAVRLLFDQEFQDADTHQTAVHLRGDKNSYSFGCIGLHTVVAACLPNGEYGTNAAAAVASDMARSFELRFCLLVGIGAGVPSTKHDIRLGDIVVSTPKGRCPGVLQYDLAKAERGELHLTGSLRSPPRALLAVTGKLESNPHHRSGQMLQGFLDHISLARNEYCNPGLALGTPSSQQEQKTQMRWRPIPVVHYGPIASGNLVVKDATLRDQLAQKHDILCFEMEAAGIMNTCDCLVIRGICDFADEHKDDSWQEYAAAVAASYAKLLLSFVRPENNHDERYDSIKELTEPATTKPRKRKRSASPPSSLDLSRRRQLRSGHFRRD
ncbi:Conidiophore development regulator abaB [Cladobotryum mycophilum]|uniref:Conidiophore development regulator abaB n=1 Tax=Cladobotryum mycophilum TaxID=491253 RepID=A0ABR0T549_9HYPO